MFIRLLPVVNYMRARAYKEQRFRLIWIKAIKINAQKRLKLSGIG